MTALAEDVGAPGTDTTFGAGKLRVEQDVVVADPEIVPVSGVYAVSVTVSITTPTAGASIYYTTDGSDPNELSTLYTSSFLLTQTTQVRAVTIDQGVSSNIVSADYTIVPSTIGDGLVGHWTFEEGAGSVTADVSGNGNTGTLQSSPTWIIENQFNSGALDFDGNDYVDVGPMDVPGSAITIAAWMRADSFRAPSSDNRIISKATGSGSQDHFYMVSGIRQSGQDRLRFRLKTNGQTTTLIAGSGALNTGVWTHVVAWYDGSEMRLYKDGIVVGSTSKSGSIDTSAAVTTRIGQNPNNYGTFDGILDDIRIYDRALNQSEIDEIIAGQPPTPDTTPPTISMTAPADGATVSSSVSITASASDNIGVVGVQFTLDGSDLGAEDLTAPYGFVVGFQYRR